METSTISPTYFGLVKDTNDALILFQLAIDGELKLIQQRLSEEDRTKYVRSGNIFIFQEEDSSIRRWTDGISWSPSRIVGDFLVYREIKKDESGHRRESSKTRNRAVLYRDRSRSPGRSTPVRTHSKRPNPELVGSLSDEDKYKEGGLVKRTITVKFKGKTYHLISYYTLEDAEEGRLAQISSDPAYADLNIYPELINSKSLRVRPNENLNPMVHEYERQPHPQLDLYGSYGRYSNPPYTPVRGPPTNYMQIASPPMPGVGGRFVDHSTNGVYTSPSAWNTSSRLPSDNYSPTRSHNFEAHPVWPSHPTPSDTGPRSGRESRLEGIYSPIQRLYAPPNQELYDNIDQSLGYSSSPIVPIPNQRPLLGNTARFSGSSFEPLVKQNEYCQSYYETKSKPDAYSAQLYETEEKPQQ